MRNVETKEIVHGLYFADKVFNRKAEATEWLYENFFNEEEESFSMTQLTEAMVTLDRLRVVEVKMSKHNHSVW